MSPHAATPSEAAPVTGFKPGNIISDANFYNGSAMTTSQVQRFLDQRVSRCTIGDAGRKPGTKWGSTKIASKCLRNFTMKTQTRPANAYCKAYPGATNESAAAIIAKVGQACGISPKVLLVMLEKEQSLVTDTWPTVRQFDIAMGYACPDSGPGGTANCDPTQTGFYQQVYRAAWQFKVYRAHPNNYNYKPFQNNRIQWHPNTSCGTSTVRIENWATAALYVYTPYRPNQAALDAGWGTGNSCSSYGNRNFYNFYKSWFESPTGLDVASELREYYNANGGQSKYGLPLRNAVRITGNGGGTIQDFQNGRITYSKSVGRTHSLTNGPFLTRYLAEGGPAGSWGWLASDATCGLRDAGCIVQTQNGVAAFSEKSGARFVPARVLQQWTKEGRESGVLGYPSAAVQRSGSGMFQRFQGGSVMVSPLGDFRFGQELTSAYVGAGGGLAGLGFIKKGTTRVSETRSFGEFERGNLYMDSQRSALRFGNGPFLDAYRKAGGPIGSWGWPSAAAKCGLIDGGCTMKFERGTAVYSKKTGVIFMNPGQATAWQQRGAQNGDLGYPKAAAQTYPDGSVQQYQKAHLIVTPTTAVRLGSGPFLDTYQRLGGPRSAWGWPTAAARCGLVDGGCTMQFERGVAVYSPKTDVAFITEPQAREWNLLGGPSGSLGYPVGDTEILPTGSVQQYQKAHLLIGPTAAVRFGSGPFWDAFTQAGGPTGTWGWPAKPAECGLADKGCRMEFSGGVATYTPAQGVTFRKR